MCVISSDRFSNQGPLCFLRIGLWIHQDTDLRRLFPVAFVPPDLDTGLASAYSEVGGGASLLLRRLAPLLCQHNHNRSAVSPIRRPVGTHNQVSVLKKPRQGAPFLCT